MTSSVNGRESRLDPDSLHELWRMQLLDELRGKLRAIEWEPALDPDGARAGALADLIRRFEAVEAEALRDRHPVELRPVAAAHVDVPSSRDAVAEAPRWHRGRGEPLLARPLLFIRRLRIGKRRAAQLGLRDDQ
jgi:hypothetical protein